MQDLKIKKMSADDLTKVVAIEQVAQVSPWSKQMFLDSLKAKHMCVVLVRSVSSEIIGYAVMSMVVGEAEVLNVCIREDMQKKGYGKFLLNYLLRIAKEKEVKQVFLEVRKSNTKAIKLYENSGFVRIDVRKNYYKGKTQREDAVILLANRF